MMNKFFFSVLCLMLVSIGNSQELTGSELLEKAIKYHDPNGNWNSFKGDLVVSMTRPNKDKRVSEIHIDIPASSFVLSTRKNDSLITSKVINDECFFSVDEEAITAKEELKKHKLTCKRAKLMKDYYTYLYGLPMKLKDEGTIINEKVTSKEFNGKEYLVLKVNYEESVGKDTWYFYFDPSTYAMKVYQFYHDETKNDGEYIILTEEEEIEGIKMPKNRAYYNKDNAYIATDALTGK